MVVVPASLRAGPRRKAPTDREDISGSPEHAPGLQERGGDHDQHTSAPSVHRVEGRAAVDHGLGGRGTRGAGAAAGATGARGQVGGSGTTGRARHGGIASWVGGGDGDDLGDGAGLGDVGGGGHGGGGLLSLGLGKGEEGEEERRGDGGELHDGR